jgi:phage terminase large subunit
VITADGVLRIETARAFVPLLEPARYKFAKGGRASGKSHFFADLWLDENVRMPLDCVMIREVQKSLAFSVKKTLEAKISAHNAGAYFDVQDKKITSAKGGLTIFEGMQNHTADSIKSLEGFDRAHTEEAQNLSRRSLDLLRPTIRKPGSEMWFAWNPRNATDPVDEFAADPPSGSVIVTANYMDNPWLSEESRKDMEYDKRRDPDKYAHVWLGGYETHSESRVFKNWSVEEFERPAGTVHRLGADWGFSIDPSCLIRCDIDGTRLYVDHEAYMIGCEITQLPDLFDRVPDARKWFITADSARPETISYMQKHGYPRINRAHKGAGSVEEGIAFLQSFDIIVHPRCAHLIDELSTYRYKRDPLTEKILPILEDKNNHVIDALRYACEGARKSGKVKPHTVVRTIRERSANGFLAA